MRKVFILAGESSGELYGALLTRALRRRWEDIRIFGIGGERMRREGVELVADISGAFGLVELISSLRKIHATYSRVVAAIEREKPEVIVCIDFPDFNIKVARRIHRTGCRILYYVSPQVWAWRRRRVHTIAGIADYIAVILPFEPEYYRDAAVPCEFVGHPIFEEFDSIGNDKRTLRERLGMNGDRPVLAVLPGSRDSELSRLFPVITEFLGLFQRSYPDFQTVLPLALNVSRERHRLWLDALDRMGVRILEGEAVRALASADAAVVASGTAALQAAFLDTPLVVIYRLSALTYFLGRMIISVKHINLVNIMLGTEVIRELIQGQASADAIAAEIGRIISDTGYREAMLGRFREVRSRFAGRHASDRVSEIVGELAGWR